MLKKFRAWFFPAVVGATRIGGPGFSIPWRRGAGRAIAAFFRSRGLRPFSGAWPFQAFGGHPWHRRPKFIRAFKKAPFFATPRISEHLLRSDGLDKGGGGDRVNARRGLFRLSPGPEPAIARPASVKANPRGQGIYGHRALFSILAWASRYLIV